MWYVGDIWLLSYFQYYFIEKLSTYFEDKVKKVS